MSMYFIIGYFLKSSVYHVFKRGKRQRNQLRSHSCRYKIGTKEKSSKYDVEFCVCHSVSTLKTSFGVLKYIAIELLLISYISFLSSLPTPHPQDFRHFNMYAYVTSPHSTHKTSGISSCIIYVSSIKQRLFPQMSFNTSSSTGVCSAFLFKKI